jgi:triosephosphate isomerase (TIM)
MSRTPFIAGNWKMHNTIAEAEELIQALLPRVGAVEDVEVVVAPVFLSLQAIVDSARGSAVGVYAQNMHEKDSGAYTGEVSAPMLRELGVYGAIVGHSERRQYFGETDETVARRIRAALDAGLSVIACVGESEEEREAGQTELVLRLQVESIADVARDSENVVVAYEPVWAIGTGRTATPETVQEAHAFIKSLLDVRVLYGGSVKPENCGELLAQRDVDGALVGGASLDLESFRAICLGATRS